MFLCDALRDFVPFVQFKNVKNAYGGMLLLVNFTKSNTSSLVLFQVFHTKRYDRF